MAGDIIRYGAICRREKTRLQKRLNFGLGDGYSIILMSRSPDAPYHDEFSDNNTVLIYEGHDTRRIEVVNPKSVDQPERTPTGTLTQNGKFHQAAQQFKDGSRTAERVKVYGNLWGRIWVYHGVFLLTDSWIVNDGTRNVFKFKLEATDENQFDIKDTKDIQRRKVIPSSIMTKVLLRDGCKCSECGSNYKLSFIHTGDSMTDNVRIICDKHRM